MKRVILFLSGGLVAAACATCGLFGKGVSPRTAERVAVFACEVEAVRPLVEGVLEPDQVMRDLYSGKLSLPRLFSVLRASEDEALAVVEALNACDKSAPEPALEPDHAVEL